MDCSITEKVALITMTNGENRHNPVFLAEINAALDAAEADLNVGAVILASNDPKCWSLGMDLDWIMARVIDPDRRDEVKAFLHGMNALYRRVLTFPVPVIAAMSGHAFGNGAIFSCAFDFRFMLSNRGFFCFPEVDVSIPFLPGMFAVVKKAVPAPLLNELSLTGRRLGGKEALERHVIHGVFDSPDEMAQGVMAFAKSFQKGRSIVAEQKRRNYQWIFDVIERDDPPVIDRLKLIV